MRRRSDFHKELSYVPCGAKIIVLIGGDGRILDGLMDGWMVGVRLQVQLDHMKLK